MTLVQAIQVLFSQTAPAGADFAGAFNALKGKRDSDLSAADTNTLDQLAETFQDFVSDPSEWVKKASAADPRHSWWVQLAQALGASVNTASGRSPPPAGSVDPTPDIEPEQGIDPDALAGGSPAPALREAGSGGGGVILSSGDSDDRPRSDKKKRGDRDERRGQDHEEGDDRDDRRHELRDRQDRRPPEPPPPPKHLFDVTSREIPMITREILAYSSYKSWSAILIETFRLIRAGTTTEQVQRRLEVDHARRLIESIKFSTERMEVQTGFHLERLLDVLESGRDLHEPDWFQANYVTGSYG